MRTSQQRISLISNASRQIHSVTCRRPRRSFHLTTPASLPRRRHFFTSNPFLSSVDDSKASPTPSQALKNEQLASLAPTKRKPTRATTTKNSLRRVAIIAQQPKRGADGKPVAEGADEDDPSTRISATCIAESFNMPLVLEILQSHGFAIDPDNTGFDSGEVVHAKGVNGGDIFVFPSGTIVTWSLPPDVVTRQLLRAAEDPHPAEMCEEDDLDFVADTARAESTMKGDLVVLGTRREHRASSPSTTPQEKSA